MSSCTVTSISVTPIFLTRPLLFLGVKPTLVSAITTFLQEFLRVTGGKSQTLKLRPAILPSLPEIAAHCNAATIALIKDYFGRVHTVHNMSITSTDLAVPIPLALACHFFGFTWNDWFMTLGGSEFELVLDPRCVYVVKKSNGCIGVVWTLNKNMSAGVIRPSVTLPTHTDSPFFPSGINHHSEDTDVSRPSSRSSNYSNFSFYSHSSASSQSSIGYFDAVYTPTKSKHSTTFSPMNTSLTTVTNTYNVPKSLNTPVAHVKATSTRYLYQGGMSTVLTGGVMLGTSS
ncbi:hypothetical protein C0993_000165 [Termitomyces sp. T159_Od127]|nr:hypothetical protein C0993_000165 [Termitomyces sp. T159_Od127]